MATIDKPIADSGYSSTVRKVLNLGKDGATRASSTNGIPVEIVSGKAYIGYSDATYEYFCFAAPGTVLTTAEWKVFRLTISNDRIMWADGNDSYDNVATDAATVAALTYA